MLRDLFNGDVDLLLGIAFLLDNLLEHLPSNISIDLFARLVDEKVFFKHVSSREHDELEFSTGSGDVDATIFFSESQCRNSYWRAR